MTKEKTTLIHQDYFGYDITEGDFVVYSIRNLFQVGRIIKSTAKMVRIAGYDYSRKSWSTNEIIGDLKYPEEVLKVSDEDVTMYLLKKKN